MAQPLTVLRSAIAASLLPGRSAAEQRTYLEISVEQVERACTLFQALQQLLVVSQTEPVRAPVDLPAMIAPIVIEQNAALDASGVTIRFRADDAIPAVMADWDRTVQALFTALKIAAAVSSRGDIFDLRLTAPDPENDGFVHLTLRTARPHGKRLGSADRVSLSLAEAAIRTQHGSYECIDDPLSISFSLPVAEADHSQPQNEYSGLRTERVH